jgi:hypothetical protein
MARHELKTWPQFFNAMLARTKTYEIRKNDRNFQVGDELFLREWDPQQQTYSGRDLTVDVTYMTKGGQWGIPEGICVMGIRIQSWRLGDQEPA